MTNPTITHTHGFLDDCGTTTNWTQAKTVTMAPAPTAYTVCQITDIGKPVTDDGAIIGALVWYDNTNRIWTVTPSLNVAAGSVMAITAGSGAGTSIGTFVTTFTSDGDVFTLSAGPTRTTDEYLYVERDITDLNTSVYTKYKVRWKTLSISSGLGVRVLAKFNTYDTAESFSQNVTDGDAQWLVGPTVPVFSSTWTVASGSFTSAKTLDKICIFADDYPDTTAAGTLVAYIDFILIYGNDFVFPNCESSTFEPRPKYAIIPIPGRTGDNTQNLGSNSAQFHCTCNLDLSNATDDWRRPQGNLIKTGGDAIPGQIFDEIAHMSYTEPWQWLDTGNRQFKTTLEGPIFNYHGERHSVELTFTEMRQGSGSTETYIERFGLNL